MENIDANLRRHDRPKGRSQTWLILFLLRINKRLIDPADIIRHGQALQTIPAK
jgi:hypothetical protein